MKQTKCSSENPALGQELGNIRIQYIGFQVEKYTLKKKKWGLFYVAIFLLGNASPPGDQKAEIPRKRKLAPQGILREEMA